MNRIIIYVDKYKYLPLYINNNIKIIAISNWKNNRKKRQVVLKDLSEGFVSHNRACHSSKD